MLRWNEINGGHDIRLSGAVKAQFNKYFVDGQLPNKNVTAEQAETVIQNVVNSLIFSDGYHIFIHFLSFPKKTEEDNPLLYTLSICPLAVIPDAPPGYEWWENWLV